jgi:hypothetical protein
MKSEDAPLKLFSKTGSGMIDPFSPLIGRRNIQTILLFRIPKCASSTLYKAIGQRNLFCREQKYLDEKLLSHPTYRNLFSTTHLKPTEAFQLFGRGVLSLFSLACVRNPFDRCVSTYGFSNGKNFGDFYGEKNSGSFNEFIDLLYEKFRRREKNFIGIDPQTAWTHDAAFSPKVILRFETLQQDWLKMIKDYQIKDLPEVLPHENKSEHKPWQEYYNEELREKVVEIFKPDFEILRYSKEIS